MFLFVGQGPQKAAIYKSSMIGRRSKQQRVTASRAPSEAQSSQNFPFGSFTKKASCTICICLRCWKEPRSFDVLLRMANEKFRQMNELLDEDTIAAASNCTFDAVFEQQDVAGC